MNSKKKNRSGEPLKDGIWLESYLGLSKSTIYRLRKYEGLPCYKIKGSYLYRPSEIDDYVGVRAYNGQE